jgi:hypothetical protein
MNVVRTIQSRRRNLNITSSFSSFSCQADAIGYQTKGLEEGLLLPRNDCRKLIPTLDLPVWKLEPGTAIK